MQSKKILYTISTYLIALVWVINGLFCKVLNGVPRHRMIVAKIIGTEYAVFLTQAIGMAEILMAIWIVSRLRPRLCAIIQIAVVATMNMMEFFLVPELLLFGKWNALFACIFIILVYCNAFLLCEKSHLQPN